MDNLRRNYTKYFSAFEQRSTDPKSDLKAHIEKKEAAFIAYSKRPDSKDIFKDRMLQEILDLQAIYDKMKDLKFYPTWVIIENFLQYSRNFEGDGLRIIIPFIENAKDERLFHFDLRENVR